MSDLNSELFNRGVIFGGVNCFNQCVSDYTAELPSDSEKECFQSCITTISENFSQAPNLFYENSNASD